jgi:VIT1/CCC1 family predicted Fe2+/Mn2+ transporter
MSMAAGEYVSVSSQSDAEHADLAREKQELADNPDFEREELAQVYVARGVEPGLARKVARELMSRDALGAHARDELGISEGYDRATGPGRIGFGSNLHRRCRRTAIAGADCASAGVDQGREIVGVGLARPMP